MAAALSPPGASFAAPDGLRRFLAFVPVDPAAAGGAEGDRLVGFGLRCDDLADVGLGVPAGEALEPVRGGGGDGEFVLAAGALEFARGPELAVVVEADRVGALAVEGGDQFFLEAGGGDREAAGGEVLEREVPGALRQIQGLRGRFAVAEDGAVGPHR